MSDNPLDAWLRERQPPPPSDEAELSRAAADPAAWPLADDVEEWTAWDVPDGPPRRRLSRRLAVAVALPWVVAAVLAAAALARTGASATVATPPSPDPTPGATAGTPEPPATVAAAGVGTAEVSAAAVVALHAAAGAQGEPARYVQAATVQGVERAGPLVVATVAAVVVEARAGRWDSASLQRWAVPLTAAAPHHPAGRPWPLPAAPTDLGWRAASDDAELRVAVVAALAAAGYDDVTVDALDEADVLLRARVRARPPFGTNHMSHEVLLRRAPTPAVLGVTAPPATSAEQKEGA